MSSPPRRSQDDNEKVNEKESSSLEERSNSGEHVFKDSFTVPEPGTPERIQADRRLVLKLDCRLLPMVFVIYIMNYIDRVAITTARLKGLQGDLHLTDVQYSTVLAILYAFYCPAQIPSNMILNYITRPSFYIGACVVTWGLTSALTGVTKNFSGLLACRIFLGLPEAAFYPGTIYLLSRWYTKKELAFRSAILYAGLMLSNAFGSLIAAGILANMEGKRGIRAWRWLFFIEGTITIVIGFIAMYILPDYPPNTRWLSPFERHIAQARLSEDAGEADKDNKEDSPLKGLSLALKDPLIWLFCFMNITQLLGLSFINFFPTLAQTLGYKSTTITLLLAAPPWIFGGIFVCLNAWHADKTGERFFHVAWSWWGVIIGFIIALSSSAIAARYVSLFLMATGYTGFAITLTWVSNTIPRPPAKRAAAIGVVNGIGNLGLLIGSYTWPVKWSPGYHASLGISLASLVIASLTALVIRQILIKKNKQLDEDESLAMAEADRTRVEEAARLEGLTFEQAMQRRKGYRYLY